MLYVVTWVWSVRLEYFRALKKKEAKADAVLAKCANPTPALKPPEICGKALVEKLAHVEGQLVSAVSELKRSRDNSRVYQQAMGVLFNGSAPPTVMVLKRVEREHMLAAKFNKTMKGARFPALGDAIGGGYQVINQPGTYIGMEREGSLVMAIRIQPFEAMGELETADYDFLAEAYQVFQKCGNITKTNGAMKRKFICY